MDPTFITRAGSEAVEAASKSGRQARVRRKGANKFNANTFSNAEINTQKKEKMKKYQKKFFLPKLA